MFRVSFRCDRRLFSLTYVGLRIFRRNSVAHDQFRGTISPQHNHHHHMASTNSPRVSDRVSYYQKLSPGTARSATDQQIGRAASGPAANRPQKANRPIRPSKSNNVTARSHEPLTAEEMLTLPKRGGVVAPDSKNAGEDHVAMG